MNSSHGLTASLDDLLAPPRSGPGNLVSAHVKLELGQLQSSLGL